MLCVPRNLVNLEIWWPIMESRHNSIYICNICHSSPCTILYWNFACLNESYLLVSLKWQDEELSYTTHHSPSVVLQMAARGVEQLTSYHPPLGALSMATHPRYSHTGPRRDPQLAYVGYQPSDHSNVLSWNNDYKSSDLRQEYWCQRYSHAELKGTYMYYSAA